MRYESPCWQVFSTLIISDQFGNLENVLLIGWCLHTNSNLKSVKQVLVIWKKEKKMPLPMSALPVVKSQMLPALSWHASAFSQEDPHQDCSCRPGAEPAIVDRTCSLESYSVSSVVQHSRHFLNTHCCWISSRRAQQFVTVSRKPCCPFENSAESVTWFCCGVTARLRAGHAYFCNIAAQCFGSLLQLRVGYLSNLIRCLSRQNTMLEVIALRSKRIMKLRGAFCDYRKRV